MKKVAVSIHAIENFTPNILNDLTGLNFFPIVDNIYYFRLPDNFKFPFIDKNI